MFYSIQQPTTSIASLSKHTSTNEPPTHSYDILLPSTQFQSIKEITRNEINVQKLLQGLATGGIATSVYELIIIKFTFVFA